MQSLVLVFVYPCICLTLPLLLKEINSPILNYFYHNVYFGMFRICLELSSVSQLSPDSRGRQYNQYEVLLFVCKISLLGPGTDTQTATHTRSYLTCLQLLQWLQPGYGRLLGWFELQGLSCSRGRRCLRASRVLPVGRLPTIVLAWRGGVRGGKQTASKFWRSVRSSLRTCWLSLVSGFPSLGGGGRLYNNSQWHCLPGRGLRVVKNSWENVVL